MLDGILGRGFSSKCKSLIKLTKSRIDGIRRKRNATQKFLKKDMADLLASGLDINAYGRAEGLLVELTVSWCYDFVEQCCDLLLNHLSIMQKQSECPKECREAVSSLMFAAARFSDLPELRDLRQMFQERFGNSLDHCLNQEFKEKSAPEPFATEKKVHLMQEIASEFAINWNSENFEHWMSKPSSCKQEHPKDNGFYHVVDDKYQSPNNAKENPPRGENLKFHSVEPSNNRQRFRKCKEADSLKRDEFDLPVEENHSGHNRSRKDHSPLQGKQEFFSGRREKESPDPKIMGPGPSSYRKGYQYPEKVDIPLHLRPADNFASISSRSEFKITSFVCKNGGADHNGNNTAARESSEGDRSYVDSLASTSSRSKVTVTSSVQNNGGGDHNIANSLTRVKSEGDRPYMDTFAATSSKCEVKATSFGCNNGTNDNGNNFMTRAKSEGDRPYFNRALPPPYVKPNVKAKDASHRPDSQITPAGLDFNGIPQSPAMRESARADQRLEDVQVGRRHPEKAVEDVGPARGNSPATEKDYYNNRDEMNSFPLAKARSSRRRHSKPRSSHDEAHGLDEDAGSGKRSSRSRRDDPRRGLQILFDDEQYQKDEEERIIDKLLMHYSKKSSTYEGGKVRRKSRSRRHDDVGPDLGEPPLSRQAEPQRPNAEFGVVPPPRSVSLPREQPSAPPEPTKVFTRAATFQLDRSNDAKHVHPKLPDYDVLAARFAALKGGK